MVSKTQLIPKMRKVQDENARKIATNNQKPGICKKCGKYSEIRSPFALCPKCQNEVSGRNQNFITLNNILYYKGEPVIEIIRKLESGEYNKENFPNWNKNSNNWYYKDKYILKDEKLLKDSYYNFTITDKI